jgi:ABC-type antimicrobial peptide transport system permease subunit
MLERRGELGLLRALGFRHGALVWLAFSEAAMLLLLGLVVGAGAAVIAVLPALQRPGTSGLMLSLAGTLALVLVSGFFWTWGATRLAVRGPLLAALRNE